MRVGDNVEERLTIQNRSSLPKPVLEVEDLTDLPGYSTGAAVGLASRDAGHGLRPRRPVREASTRWAPSEYPIQTSSASFAGSGSSVIVSPSSSIPGSSTCPTSPSLRPTCPETRRPAREPTTSLRTRLASGSTLPGDSMSRVHWPSTARMSKLMSKEFDLGRSSEVWALVDLHQDVQAGELEESTDEYAVSIAASLARKYVSNQLPFGLVAYGDRRYFLPSETGAGQFEQLMEFLAMSRAKGEAPIEDVLAREEMLWGPNTTLIIITSSPRIEWAVAVKQLMRRRVRTVAVLLDGQSFGTHFDTLAVLPELRAEGVPTYLVRRGDDISVS